MEDEIKRRRGRPPVVREPGLEEETTEIANPVFETVIVARGKTVVMPHPTRTKIIREGEDGRPVRAPLHVEHGEGDEVTLEASEATRLISLGIVHRPGEEQLIPAAAALTEGARVVEMGGPRY